jgi:hypothetical protein
MEEQLGEGPENLDIEIIIFHNQYFFLFAHGLSPAIAFRRKICCSTLQSRVPISMIP